MLPSFLLLRNTRKMKNRDKYLTMVWVLSVVKYKKVRLCSLDKTTFLWHT